MAAAMIKDGETASGPPARSLWGSSGLHQFILQTTQTGVVLGVFLTVLFDYVHRLCADWKLLHVLEVWEPLVFLKCDFFWLLLWVSELSANISKK